MELPIWARITIDGRRSECSTGKSILSSCWNNETQRAIRKCPDQEEVHEYLTMIYGAIKEHFNALLVTTSFVSADLVKQSLIGKRENKTFLGSLYRIQSTP